MRKSRYSSNSQQPKLSYEKYYKMIKGSSQRSINTHRSTPNALLLYSNFRLPLDPFSAASDHWSKLFVKLFLNKGDEK